MTSTPTYSVAGDIASKKRKREESITENDGRPLIKHARSESPPRDVEDLPLDPTDAHKILTVLESIDSDGLLERLFPFPSSAQSRTTFCALLQDPSRHSLRVLRDALNNLLPSSRQPRALLAVGASNQQRFCDLVQRLFNEIASGHSGSSVALGTSLLQSDDEEDAEHLLPFENRKRKYALVQRLPSGDWWSSTTIPRDGDVGLTRAAAKALTTKQAELVSIIPSQPVPAEDMPLFATLKPAPMYRTKDDPRRSTTLPNRTLPAPKLLDYGTYITFGPSFDSDGAEIGNDQVHQLVHESMLRRKARQLRRQLLEKQQREAPEEAGATTMEVAGSVDQAMDSLSLTQAIPSEEAMRKLRQGLSKSEAEILDHAFKALQAELGVSELLERNAGALDDLIRMQRERLRSSQPIPSDLEQQLANALQSSLALLLSMRPRTASHSDSFVVPPPAILRALHRSLPVAPISGWRGTLATNRPTSLRDDATMHVKATAKAQAAATAAAAAGVHQGLPNGVPRAPIISTPSTPIPQNTPNKVTPFATSPMYPYSGGNGYSYQGPGIPPNAQMPMGARMMQNPKGPIPQMGPWPGYPGPMPPPYLGKGQPAQPMRANPSFYKQ